MVDESTTRVSRSKAFSIVSLIAALLAAATKLRLSALGLSPVPIDLPDLPSLAPNHRLSSVVVEKLGEDDLLYPESLVHSPAHGGKYAFASLGDGRIVRLATSNPDTWDDVTWTTLGRTGGDEDENDEKFELCGRGGPTDVDDMEKVCGRPLGLLLAKRSTVDPYHQADGNEDEDVLLVADSSMGFLMVTRIYGILARVQIKSLTSYRFGLLNAVAVTSDGAVYLTETSTSFSRRRIFHAAMDGRPTGRLLRYNPGGYVEVLADGLHMANGIVPTHDGSGLLIVCGVTILRYDLVEEQMDPEPFVAVMPGTGDNIKAYDHLPTGEQRKCYWAALGGKYAMPFSLLKALSDRPMMRSFLLAVLPYEKIVDLIPQWMSLAVYDEKGELIDMLRDDSIVGGDDESTGRTSGKGSASVAPWLSEAESMGNYLFLASWYNPFLARVKVENIGES